eukprot:gene12992-5355_t
MTHVHRVKVHFRHPDQPDAPLAQDCYTLFWFRKPAFLLWMFQQCHARACAVLLSRINTSKLNRTLTCAPLAFADAGLPRSRDPLDDVELDEIAMMLTSITLTLIAYRLYRDGNAFESEGGPGPFSVIIIADVLLLVYTAVNVLPVYALVSTVGTGNPRKLLKEIIHQKMFEEEEDEFEGLGGLLLHFCIPHRHESDEFLEDAALHDFVKLLADQAGVIGHHSHGHSQGHADQNEFREQIMPAWQELTHQWRLAMQEARPMKCDITLSGDLSSVRRVFNHFDADESGYISTFEIASVLRALGTRLTSEELDDMVQELDVDGSDQIEFKEFVLFILFKFFDINNDGYVTRDDIQKSLTRIEMQMPMEKIEQLIDFDMRRRLSLFEFICVFDSTNFVEKDSEGQAIVHKGNGHRSKKEKDLVAPSVSTSKLQTVEETKDGGASRPPSPSKKLPPLNHKPAEVAMVPKRAAPKAEERTGGENSKESDPLPSVPPPEAVGPAPSGSPPEAAGPAASAGPAPSGSPPEAAGPAPSEAPPKDAPPKPDPADDTAKGGTTPTQERHCLSQSGPAAAAGPAPSEAPPKDAPSKLDPAAHTAEIGTTPSQGDTALLLLMLMRWERGH